MREFETEERANSVGYVGSAEQRKTSAAKAQSRCQPSTLRAAFANEGCSPKLPENCSTIHLLYDSFAQPALAGTRSASMSVRQMLYRADPYQIDIEVETQPDRNRLIVTGQLLDADHPEIASVGVQVTLSDGREGVANTVTNQFGEFRGEVSYSGYLELSFLRRDGKPIVILLRGAPDPVSRSKN